MLKPGTLNRTQGETISIICYPREKKNQYPRDLIKYSRGKNIYNPVSESKIQDFMQLK